MCPRDEFPSPLNVLMLFVWHLIVPGGVGVCGGGGNGWDVGVLSKVLECDSVGG